MEIVHIGVKDIGRNPVFGHHFLVLVASGTGCHALAAEISLDSGRLFRAHHGILRRWAHPGCRPFRLLPHERSIGRRCRPRLAFGTGLRNAGTCTCHGLNSVAAVTIHAQRSMLIPIFKGFGVHAVGGGFILVFVAGAAGLVQLDAYGACALIGQISNNLGLGIGCSVAC